MEWRTETGNDGVEARRGITMYLFAESCCTADNNYVKVGGLFADKRSVHTYLNGPLCAGRQARTKEGRKEGKSSAPDSNSRSTHMQVGR